MSRSSLTLFGLSVLTTFFAISEGYQFPYLYPHATQLPSKNPSPAPSVRNAAPATPRASMAFSVTPSSMPSISQSSEPKPSNSGFPSPSKSSQPSSTATPSNSDTPSPSNSASPSSTPSSSASPTSSNSGAPSPSNRAEPSSTPSESAAPTPSNSASSSPSSSSEPSPTTSNSAAPSVEPPRTVAGPGSCTVADFTNVKNRLRATVSRRADRNRWPARFLFLAFHDCLPQKCDASIVFEQHRPPNRKVGVTISLLNSVRRGTCVSLADSIKIGLELSMELSDGPAITCPKGTKDATGPNPDGLPGPGEDFLSLIKKFTDQGGITPIEAISANFGGHALGGFGVHPVTGMPAFPFTRRPHVFNNRYCIKTLEKTMLDSPPFTLTLRSDDTFAKNEPLPLGSSMPHGVVIPSNLRLPAVLQNMTGVNLRNISTGKDVVALFAASNEIFSHVFKSFLEKLCAL